MASEQASDLAVAQGPQDGGRHRGGGRPSAIRAMAGRLSWGLGDQAVSSLTNFAVSAFVAHSLGVTAFGVFTIAWVTYSVVVNVSRGLSTDPLEVRFSGVAVDKWRKAVSRSSGTAVTTGAALGSFSLLLGVGIGGSVGSALLGLGIVLPVMLLQDSWRLSFFAAGRGDKAFASDLVRAAALVPAMILADRHGSILGFVLAWGLSASFAAAYGCVQARVLPRPFETVTWIRHHRDLGLRYLVENASQGGTLPLQMYGLGAISGLAAVGAVRGAQVLMGPFMVLIMGLSVVAVPEAARVLQRGVHRLPRFGLLLGACEALGALMWGVALLPLLPDAVGQRIFGTVWSSAMPLVLPTALAAVGASFSVGALVGLRALAAARRSLAAQLFGSAMLVSGALIGAMLGGALGSVWGLAAAAPLELAVCWTQLHAGMREHIPSSDAVAEDVSMKESEDGEGWR